MPIDYTLSHQEIINEINRRRSEELTTEEMLYIQKFLNRNSSDYLKNRYDSLSNCIKTEKYEKKQIEHILVKRKHWIYFKTWGGNVVLLKRPHPFP